MHSRPVGTAWVRFAMYGQGDIKEFSNDFWYSVSSGTITETTMFQVISDAFYNALILPWKTALSSATTIRGCFSEFSDGTNVWTTNTYQNNSGSGLADPWPEDVALVVRKQTADGTPSGKGRWYFTGGGQVDVTGSYLNASGQADWQAFAIELKAPIIAGGVTLSPAHFSRKTGLLYPILQTPVIALMGTRRRRRGPF